MSKILFNYPAPHICLIDFIMNMFFKRQLLVHKNTQVLYGFNSFYGCNEVIVNKIILINFISMSSVYQMIWPYI